MNLTYHDNAALENLAPGECVIRWCTGSGAARRPTLWFYVARDSDGVLEDYGVPINPGGGYLENGPGGRTWGFTKVGPNTWQVSPSINIEHDTRDAKPGPQPTASAWHQTPTIVCVPDPEPWTRLLAARGS